MRCRCGDEEDEHDRTDGGCSACHCHAFKPSRTPPIPAATQESR